MSKKVRSVVFGGSGFLGSHIADSLSEAGHEVIIFDLVESPYIRSDQKMVIGTMEDTDALLKVTSGVDYVFHFAGVADIGYARQNPKDTYFHNVINTL